MSNKYKANLIALLHLGLIVFGIISLPLLFLLSWWNMVVIVLAVLSVLSWIAFKGECWITHLENHYRKKDGSHYEIGYIKHYLKKVFNIDATYFVINVLLYGYLGVLVLISIAQFL
jgi:c-di-AMP phosphodiesterase-like protein